MNDRAALHALATAMGVATRYTDGLGTVVDVADDTLLRVVSAMGVPVHQLSDCPVALIGFLSRPSGSIPDVMVAWDGVLQWPGSAPGPAEATIELEHGEVVAVSGQAATHRLPLGYHILRVPHGSGATQHTIIAAPVAAFRHDASERRWGIGAQLGALRSARSRALGDLRDLETTCEFVGAQGGDLVMLLPLLPTFNTPPVEPSPYSPVSRLFWSELILDLGSMHRPCGTVDQLDVRRGHDEVWAALHAAADAHPSDDLELERYARFRGVQEVWGRNWRDWPEPARSGDLSQAAYDETTTSFHRRAQQMVRAQLEGLATRLDVQGVHLGLDLTVGVHADGYDAWSRQHLFANGMSVGAPPDPGFPSGQDWGFAPVLPAASRQEGHRYLAESLRHQMQVAGVLRIDHIMALARLYWIPHGMGLHEGTYVSYPADELFAVITLESWRSRCEVIGENLGNVPPEVNAALARHQILGLYLAMFQATGPDTAAPPMPDDVALIGSHDTPTLHGWLMGEDIDDRMRHGLLEAQDLSRAREEREAAAAHLMDMLGLTGASPDQLLHGLLQWLGRSPAAWVVPWLEDLWLEPVGVNLPGTPASVRGNWQRPMRLTLEHVRDDHQVLSCLATLREARAAATH